MHRNMHSRETEDGPNMNGDEEALPAPAERHATKCVTAGELSHGRIQDGRHKILELTCAVHRRLGIYTVSVRTLSTQYSLAGIYRLCLCNASSLTSVLPGSGQR